MNWICYFNHFVWPNICRIINIFFSTMFKNYYLYVYKFKIFYILLLILFNGYLTDVFINFKCLNILLKILVNICLVSYYLKKEDKNFCIDINKTIKIDIFLFWKILNTISIIWNNFCITFFHSKFEYDS